MMHTRKPGTRAIPFLLALGVAGCNGNEQASRSSTQSFRVEQPQTMSSGSIVAEAAMWEARRAADVLYATTSAVLESPAASQLEQSKYAFILDALTRYAREQDLLAAGDSLMQPKSPYAARVVDEARRIAEKQSAPRRDAAELDSIAASLAVKGSFLIGAPTSDLADNLRLAESERESQEKLNHSVWRTIFGSRAVLAQNGL